MIIRSGRWDRSSATARQRIKGRRLVFEDLEPRLALTWAGVPPTAIGVPSSAVAVTLNSQSDATGSASIATTEVDYYSFTATQTGSYTISATTPSSSVDTVLGVFSASGQRLAYNDDIVYATNTDSRLTINLTAGARYYIGITNYSSSSRGSYFWAIDGPAGVTVTDDAYENNDSLASASNLGTLTATRTVSQLVMADSQDWFRFTTSATGTGSNTIALSFQNAQGNLQLELYNSSGTLLATSAGTGNGESISLSGRVAGTYYARVYGASGATHPSYSLTVNPPATTTIPGGFQITLNMSGLTASQQVIFRQAAARWAQVITGDLPNATYRGQVVDDLLIDASAISIDGVNGVLGQAGPDALRSGSRLPYHGIMQFDSADLARMETGGLLFSVVMHEMGHVLGIGTIWDDRGMLSGAGGNNPIFVGAQATAAYNQLYGTSASGVPVENTGGSGTRDSHWRDSTFTNELMTGWAGPGTNLPLSVITIGSLADIGYTVNYAAADTYVRSLSTSALASIASARSGTASLVAFDDATIFSTFQPIDVASSAVTRRVTGASMPAAVSLNASTVDRLMADSLSETSNSIAAASAPLLTSPQENDALASAWEALGVRWNEWPWGAFQRA
jgi:hypothetical protein